MPTSNRPITQYEKLELEDAFWTYKVWEGIRRHFNYDNYSWDDYGPMANAKLTTFMGHRHRWAYVKLHRRFRGNETGLICHVAANFMLNKKFYIINALSHQALANAKDYIRENEDFYYNLRLWTKNYIGPAVERSKTNSMMSLIKPVGTQPSWLLKQLLTGDMPMGLAVGLDRILHYQPAYHKVYKDNFAWTDFEYKLKKAYPFYVYDTDDAKLWLRNWVRENGYN